jgi:hypothetical protein
MPRALQIFVPISVWPASSEESHSSSLEPVLLFSGIGLFAFLIAALTGVQGLWF